MLAVYRDRGRGAGAGPVGEAEWVKRWRARQIDRQAVDVDVAVEMYVLEFLLLFFFILELLHCSGQMIVACRSAVLLALLLCCALWLLHCGVVTTLSCCCCCCKRPLKSTSAVRLASPGLWSSSGFLLSLPSPAILAVQGFPCSQR